MTYSAGWAHGCRWLYRRDESGDGSRCQPYSRVCKSCVPNGSPPPEVGAPKRRAELPQRCKSSEQRSKGKEEHSFFQKGDTREATSSILVSLLRSEHQKPCARTACSAPRHYPGCSSWSGSAGTGIFITPMISLLDACLSSKGRSFIQILSPRCHSCSAPTHSSGAWWKRDRHRTFSKQSSAPGRTERGILRTGKRHVNRAWTRLIRTWSDEDKIFRCGRFFP